MLPLAHAGEHFTGHQEERTHVGRHAGVPVIQRQLLDGIERRDAGVVHQHVHGAETPLALRHDEPRSVRLCHVGPEAIARPRDLEYLRSLRREHPRGGKADPAARTGDYARLAVQPEIHGPASCQGAVSFWVVALLS